LYYGATINEVDAGDIDLVVSVPDVYVDVTMKCTRITKMRSSSACGQNTGTNWQTTVTAEELDTITIIVELTTVQCSSFEFEIKVKGKPTCHFDDIGTREQRYPLIKTLQMVSDCPSLCVLMFQNRQGAHQLVGKHLCPTSYCFWLFCGLRSKYSQAILLDFKLLEGITDLTNTQSYVDLWKTCLNFYDWSVSSFTKRK